LSGEQFIVSKLKRAEPGHSAFPRGRALGTFRERTA
jgi:hypothetical protein